MRLMELTRFYIQLVKDPHGPDVGLFIGNLPLNLSQRKYENIINEFLDESKSSNILLTTNHLAVLKSNIIG